MTTLALRPDLVPQIEIGAPAVSSTMIHVRTKACLEFIDLTQRVRDHVRASGIREGLLNLQSLHTTTAILINENEPLLLADLRRFLERLAPRNGTYEHDDFSRRAGPLPPDEPVNGHSHLKAVALGASTTLNIFRGEPVLGRWQSVFLVELDQARRRTVSLMAMGRT